MAWLTTSLRRLRHDRASAVGLFALVLVTAFVFALGPRLLTQVADQALRDDVAAAPAAVRDIQLLQDRRIGPAGGDPLGAVDVRPGPTSRTGSHRPSETCSSTGSTGSILRAGGSWPDTKSGSFLTLRVEQGVGDRIRYVRGRAPAGGGRIEPCGRDDHAGLRRSATRTAISSETRRG